MGVSGVQRLVRFRGDRGRLNGNCRSNHFGMVRLDVIPSPSQIYVIPVQDWISNGSGVWCISGAVLVYDDECYPLNLTTFLCYNHRMKRLRWNSSEECSKN